MTAFYADLYSKANIECTMHGYLSGISIIKSISHEYSQPQCYLLACGIHCLTAKNSVYREETVYEKLAKVTPFTGKQIEES